jgi:membrane-associated phospholipid phosphatase
VHHSSATTTAGPAGPVGALTEARGGAAAGALTEVRGGATTAGPAGPVGAPSEARGGAATGALTEARAVAATGALTEAEVGAATGPPDDLHRSPPLTFRQIRHRRPWLLPAALTVVVVLGAVAAVHGGGLLVWDMPITDAFVSLRSPWIDRAALWASRLGSTPVVLIAGAAGVALAARRCHSVAIVMLVTVAARPPVEWLLKELVGRPRPAGARLVVGTGFSYPSGHVLAAAATWGFVPVIAGLYIHRRWVWWALTTLAWSVIALVAWSRVWLGVHWISDVVGSLAIALIALSAAETLIERRHRPKQPPRARAPAVREGA